MGLRNDLKENIEKQLKQEIQNYMACTVKDVDYNTIYNEFIQYGFIGITSPEEQKEPPLMQMLTFSSLKDFKGGNSIKPGNVTLNMKMLMAMIPSIVEASFNIASDFPVLKICAALNIWKTVKQIFGVEISRDQAFVIVALWKNCDSRHRILIENGYYATNKLYEKYGEPIITDVKYHLILDSLEKLQCIELDNGEIWLRERVSRKYIDHV